MVVFFRNNHYNTLTKHKNNLYLLVTDFGYADVNSVVWEKLDVIDGDTEYVTGEFQVLPAMVCHLSTVATGEQLIPEHAQSQADYHLALQLSRGSSKPSGDVAAAGISDSTEGDRNSKHSDFERTNQPMVAVGVPIGIVSQQEKDMLLALQLQRQEEKREERIRSQVNSKFTRQPKAATKDSECVIS